jgi:hypothetical protein
MAVLICAMPQRLLAGARGNFADEGVHLPGVPVDLRERGRDTLADLPAMAGAGDRVLDLARGLAGGGGGALGEAAHLVGDHGKTRAGLARAGHATHRVNPPLQLSLVRTTAKCE